MSKTHSTVGSWLGVVITMAMVATTYADDLTINNLTLPNVRITGITDGKVEYISAGTRRTADLSDVTGIGFSRYPNYQRAMELMADEPGQAADLLRDLATSVREDYLRPLMRLRLSEALDAAGRFESALEQYLQAVSGDNSVYFASRVPARIPQEATGRQAAQTALKRAIDQTDDARVKAALTQTMAKLADPEAMANDQTPDAADPADTPAQPTAVPVPVPSSQAGTIRLTTVENLLERERWDDALQQVNSFANQPASERLQAELYYYRGRAQAGKGEHTAAALSLLRVSIHFPDHALAVTALELAGHELKKSDRVDSARKVWQAALEKTNDPATQRRLQQAIASL